MWKDHHSVCGTVAREALPEADEYAKMEEKLPLLDPAPGLGDVPGG